MIVLAPAFTNESSLIGKFFVRYKDHILHDLNIFRITFAIQWSCGHSNPCLGPPVIAPVAVFQKHFSKPYPHRRLQTHSQPLLRWLVPAREYALTATDFWGSACQYTSCILVNIRFLDLMVCVAHPARRAGQYSCQGSFHYPSQWFV